MTTPDRDADANRLSQEALATGDATGWFERLYAEADSGAAIVPWDRGGPHPLLVEWATRRTDLPGRRTLVVGCGLGEDAAYLAGLGLEVTGFDVAPTAIEAARRRFPTSPVDFRVADLLDPPGQWHQHFDLVYECYTVQALPPRLRTTAVARVADFVGPGGTLVALAAGRDAGVDVDGPPWPLDRAEVESYADHGLVPTRIEELRDGSGSFHWRAEFDR